MRITFPDKSTLVSVLNAVREFSEYIRFEITGPNAKAIILDSTHVSVTCLEFIVSSIGLDGGCSVMFNIANLLKVIDLGKTGNEVDIEISSDDADVATVTMDDGAVTAAVKLFDNDMDEMEPPDMVGTEIRVNPAEFSTRIKDLANLGDCVVLTPRRDAIELSVDADLGRACVIVNTLNSVTAWDRGMSFAIRYLVTLLKVSKLFDALMVVLTEDMPLGLKMKSDHVSIGFYLAPKFDDESE